MSQGRAAVGAEPSLRPAGLAASAARGAALADAERRLAPEVAAGILEAGFARHFVPASRGGAAGGWAELLGAVATVAEGCASTAWCASVLAGAARMGAFLPEEGQEELWAEGPDTTVVGALVPRGAARPVAGGWRVSGAWDFTSGVGFSDWALVCAPVPEGAAGPEGAAEGPREATGSERGRAPWFFALPRAAYRVAETWNPVGLRGTASHTLLVDDVFVPAHRGFARERMWLGRPVGSRARCHTVPLPLVSGLLFGAPALGAARAALRDGTRGMAAGAAGGAPRPEATLTVARAASAVDAAGLLMERAARTADAPRAGPHEIARNQADCAFAVERLVDAVEAVYRRVGSSAQLADRPLQRAWRDIHTLASHVALRFESVGAAYGTALLETGRGAEPSHHEPADGPYERSVLP